MSLKAIWQRIPEWGQAFLIAVVLLLLVHLFVLRWATVRSTSMYATLLPGDLVGVERWPAWTGLHREDILVFHDPMQDDRPMRQRQLLVKRIAAIPGDELRIKDGKVFINGMPTTPTGTARWSVRLKNEADVPELMALLGLPADHVLPGQTTFDLPLNEPLVQLLKARPEVLGLEPQRSTLRTKGFLFPYGPNYRWSNDNYGPLLIPGRKDTVDLNVFTLPVYDRVISRYEGNQIHVADGELTINSALADQYVIKQDYYFVLGDSRDHSSDSRYWGFVPADHVVGRAGFVLLNADGLQRPLGQGRFFIGL